MTILTRRQFSSIATGTVASSLTRSLWAREVSSRADSRYFYFALVADTHIIAIFYFK